jgi:hypothetical protein
MTLRTRAALLACSLALGACGGEEGPTGITPGMAVAKMCHQLSRTGAAVDLTLEFGEPAIARIIARTNTCAPPPNMPCTPIPVGRVPVRLLEGDRVLARATFILQNGREYGFEPIASPTGPLVIQGVPLNAGACMLDFLPAPDGGFPDLGAPREAGGGDASGVDGLADAAGADGGVGLDAPPAEGGAPDAGVVADAAVDAAAAPDAGAGDDAGADVAVDAAAAGADSAVD